MKTEVSAGGIVIRQVSGVWEVVLIKDMNNTWTFPKGKIDQGESFEQAARREITEEIGLRELTVLKKLPAVTYTYKKNGLIHKTVHYYLFKASGNEPLVNQIQEGIHNATWMSLDRAIEIIGYSETNKILLTKSKQWILNLRQI